MILEAIDIRKLYQKKSKQNLCVLDGVSLSVKEGEVLAIVGPSGAGKSTLLHILGGLDDDCEGSVFFQGKDVYNLDEKSRSKLRNENIGFVFQFYHLLPEFTALENVLMPILIKKKDGSSKRYYEEGMDLLKQINLENRSDHKPSELSGGEQQRVAIARALINDPQIVFCDEPTGNLDSQSGKEIIDLLIDLNKRNKQTLIIITHDENVAKRAHRIIHIRDGKIIPDLKN